MCVWCWLSKEMFGNQYSVPRQEKLPLTLMLPTLLCSLISLTCLNDNKQCIIMYRNAASWSVILSMCKVLSLSKLYIGWNSSLYNMYPEDMICLGKYLKVSAHSFKRFTSRLLKLSFSLSLFTYKLACMSCFISSSCEEHGTSEHYKTILSMVGFEPTTPHSLQITSQPL